MIELVALLFPLGMALASAIMLASYNDKLRLSRGSTPQAPTRRLIGRDSRGRFTSLD